jgi:hypothetical protein
MGFGDKSPVALILKIVLSHEKILDVKTKIAPQRLF